jgi:hypothetical protein
VRAAAGLAVALGLAQAACGFETPQPTQLSRVSVLRYDPGMDCYDDLTAATWPVDPALGFNICGAPPSDAGWRGGVDQVEVVVDYGPDVQFEATATVPPPTVAVTADGQPASVAMTPSAPIPAGGGRYYFTVDFIAPPIRSTNVRVGVSVASGFSYQVPTTFAVSPPTPTIAVTGCAPGDTCTATAGVGSVEVTVTSPGSVSQEISFRSLVNGIQQAESIPAVTTKAKGDHAEWVISFPVPITDKQPALWVIEADLGPETAHTDAIQLGLPTIEASLACGSSCTLAPGAATGVTVVAPEGIRADHASLTATLDGVPVITGGTINLDRPGPTAGTVAGDLPLTAPAKTGQWQIDVSVAGYYRASSVFATIQ